MAKPERDPLRSGASDPRMKGIVTSPNQGGIASQVANKIREAQDKLWASHMAKSDERKAKIREIAERAESAFEAIAEDT